VNKNSVDRQALRCYRLSRIREQLQQHDYAAVVFFDPINIRYATDTSNMQVWVLHNPVRYAFVPLEGPVERSTRYAQPAAGTILALALISK
jgi:Xaa-Pro aminopeptidase